MQVIERPNHGTPRIPREIQAIYLDGNRGIDASTQPPNKSATKSFLRRSWWSGHSRSKVSGAAKTSDTKPVLKEPKSQKKKKINLFITVSM
jgi:hypothetical protein